MANRRMFSKVIIDSDEFLEMPVSARLLYFDLGMRADDDGFVQPKRIMQMIGASDDDLRVLIAKNFLIPFEKRGVIVITHWNENNYIQKDRYKATIFTEEKGLLSVDENDFYLLNKECIQNGYKLDTQVRLGKVRLGKESIGKDSKENQELNNSSKKQKPEVIESLDLLKEKFFKGHSI